ncbi:MAG TPA: ASKHA domain-containing protein [Syntrophomonadaceae bacterium]|nr:ASKHA domain-containing protein [Syntrophomonadaceae bacterium]
MSDKVAVTVISSTQKEYIVWGFKGQSVHEVLLLHNYDYDAYCGGRGTCGKCKMRIEGSISEVTKDEQAMLLPEESKQNLRLACKTIILGPVTAYLDTYEAQTKSVLYPGIENMPDGKTKIKSFFIPGLDKEFGIPIYRRIKDALVDYELNLSPENINELLSIDRIGRPSLELKAVIFKDKLVKYVSRGTEQVYGIALDIGSTSLYAVLVDLIDGKNVAISSKANMQRIYGADILSRLSYAIKNKEAEHNLHQILVNNINSMIEEIIAETGILSRQIYSYIVVGNPVMLHFLTRISISSFASSPFLGAFADELQLRAKDIGILGNFDAELTILPQIGGFVGADTIGALLNLKDDKTCYLMIDIGTNGEIVLHKDGQMWATSAAAGPAFEGGHITHGVRAGQGSIDKIFLNKNEELEFSFIGEGPVRGLCGSAIIDLLAYLLQTDYIDVNGIINPQAVGHLKVINHDSDLQLLIYDQDNILPGNPIIFTQEDIRQVQLAKSAIKTAIDLLMDVADISYEELDNIFLAGTFGNYLNPASSITIGLLPEVKVEKVRNIGNAAGNGAILALLSAEERAYASKLSKLVNYIDLANHPDFQDRFIENLNFTLGS